MKINSRFSEWENIIEGINRSSVATSIPQLSHLNLTGAAALAAHPELFTSASELAMNNLDIITRTLNSIQIPDMGLSGIQTIASQMESIVGQYDFGRISANLGNTMTMFSSMAEKVNMPVDRFSNAIAAAEALHNSLSFIDSLGLDNTRLTAAVGLALQRISEREEYEIDDISPLVAECYEAETEEEKEVLQAVAASAGTKEQTEKKKMFSAIVLPIILFLLTPFYQHFADAVVQKITADNPPVINQYYIQNITNNFVIEGYDVNDLRMWGYRIVNRDIILRAKPGQSSHVTGRLSKGKIVRVIGKYRKWVEVTWLDENSEAQFGWIQNYKLSPFSD